MEFLPLHFQLTGKSCLVVGGGEVALRKTELLLKAGAMISLVAPEISAELTALLAGREHQLIRRAYQPEDLNEKILVVSATDNPEVNEQVSRDAQSLFIPVNVVDQPSLCSVIFPAIIDRDPVVISVSTGGGSPVLTRYLRELIESMLPEGISRLGRYLANRRATLKHRFQNIDQRRKHTEMFFESPGFEAAQQGEHEFADTYLLPAEGTVLPSTGEVYIVGAGPGDPELLTLKALQLMQKADVVLYDNLVSDAILNRLRRDARKEYVGKIGRDVSTRQESINELLVQYAQQGHRVLRLKGGDPFIFGRGAEEMESLIEAGIPCHVVPGITASSGCAAYAGIPLTHRDYSQSVRFVTGHPKDGEVALAWQEFSHKNQTIVFYMGLGGLASISRQLMLHGRARDTPVAVVSKGTLPEQIVVVSTLENVLVDVAEHQIKRPTLIIVGEVVAFREKFLQLVNHSS